MKRKEKPHSIWLRCAWFVASQYEQQKPADANRNTTDFTESARRSDQLRLRLSLVRSRRWRVAEAKAREDYHRQLRILRENVLAELSGEAGAIELAVNEVELFRDLFALSEEFASAKFDKKDKRLSVVTKDISLEGIQLGAYRVELHLDSLSSSRPYYEVIAIDANRPSSNDDVTHPHVQDNRLCEGDGQPAIKLALRQGRLLDFFQLVEQVLGTYNPSSAYVTIRDWDGTTCGHCGYSVDPDDCRQCAGCDALICDECVCRCSDCDDSFCGNCDDVCSGCLESVCKSCIRICSECEERHCSDCLSNNERCTNCEEKSKENSKPGDDETEIHAECVGEAVVSA